MGRVPVPTNHGGRRGGVLENPVHTCLQTLGRLQEGRHGMEGRAKARKQGRWAYKARRKGAQWGQAGMVVWEGRHARKRGIRLQSKLQAKGCAAAGAEGGRAAAAGKKTCCGQEGTKADNAGQRAWGMLQVGQAACVVGW